MECLLFQNNNKSTRIASTYEDKILELYIINETESFYCKITPKDVEEIASRFDMNVDDYMDSLITYMRKVNSDISVDVSADEFIVYKNKKIKYFCTKVQKTDYSYTIGKVLDSISKSIMGFKEKASDLSTINEKLQTENQIVKDKLKDYVIKNDEREKKLYSCFIQVLNEKKKRIRFLTDLLEAKDIKKTTAEASSSRGLEDASPSTSRRVEVLSDSNSDEYNTDDEVAKLTDEKMIEEYMPEIPSLPRRVPRKDRRGGTKLRTAKSDINTTPNEEPIQDKTRATSLSPIMLNTQDIINRI